MPRGVYFEVRTPSGVHYAVRAWGNNNIVTARMRAAFHRANVRADAPVMPEAELKLLSSKACRRGMATAGRNDVRASTADGVRRGEWSGEQMYNLYVDGSDPLTAGELNWSSVYYETQTQGSADARAASQAQEAARVAAEAAAAAARASHEAESARLREQLSQAAREVQEAKTAAALARARGGAAARTRRGAAGRGGGGGFASAEAAALVH